MKEVRLFETDIFNNSSFAMADYKMINTGESVAPWGFFKFFRRVVLITAFLGLIASNVLSLISDSFHAAAYGLLVNAASIAGERVLSRMVSHSPTAMADKKVSGATQRLKKDYVELDARHKTLETNHRVLKENHATLESKTVKRKEALRKFSSKTIQRVSKTTAMELAHLPDRAIPYAGIIVLLGVTAYEINSDCEMLKELKVLNLEHEMKSDVSNSEVCGVEVPSAQQIWGDVKKRSNSVLQPVYDQLLKWSPELKFSSSQ